MNNQGQSMNGQVQSMSHQDKTAKKMQKPSGSMGLTLLALFVAVFTAMLFTKDLYQEMLGKEESYRTLQSETVAQEKELETLNTLKSQASSSGSIAEIRRYAGQFREDEILVGLMNVIGPTVTVGDVSMEPGSKLPSGLTLGNVSVNVQAQNLQEFLKMLDRLSDENSERRFFLKGLSFPLDFTPGLPVITVLTLGFYHL